MKIKVDKKEYEDLLKRVRELEEDREADCKHFRWLEESLQKRMEDFFKHKCMTVVIKRDKDEIVAEVRKQAMDNLFKEEKRKFVTRKLSSCLSNTSKSIQARGLCKP